MIGTEVFHQKFSPLSLLSTPLSAREKKFRGSRDGGFQRNFRNSAILRSLSSAREIFARGMIGTGVFHRKFSQLSHFSTPFVVTRKKFRGSRDRDFSQKCFRNSYILRPICRHEKKISRGKIRTKIFSQKIFASQSF